MKILLATHWTVPQSIGGLWPFILQLRRGLENLGHQVDILGQNEEGTGFTVYNKGLFISKDELLPLVKAKLDSCFAQKLNFYHYEYDRLCFQLAAALFNVDDYDIIHAQDAIAALSIRKINRKNIPIVTSIHGSLPLNIYHSVYSSQNSPPDFSEVKNQNIYQYNRLIEKWGMQASNLVHTSSNWACDLLIEDYQIPRSSIVTFPYGLDIEALTSSSSLQTLPPKNGKRVIVFTGRLTPIKGLSVLIDALELLKQKCGNWQCWIVGDGELMEPLRSSITQKLLNEDILLLGQRKDIFSILKQSDIFVLPSLQDNQPFSVMEAQVAGLPVVVSDTGGLSEMVQNGITGFIVPAGNYAILSEKLELLLQNNPIREQLTRQAEAFGRRNWSFETMVKQALTMYRLTQDKQKFFP